MLYRFLSFCFVQYAQSVSLSVIPLAIQVVYMNTQDGGSQNSCKSQNIDPATIVNQIALPADVFSPKMCGLQVAVRVGGNTVEGTVIDSMSSTGRVAVSENLFQQFAPLSQGVVQGEYMLHRSWHQGTVQQPPAIQKPMVPLITVTPTVTSAVSKISSGIIAPPPTPVGHDEPTSAPSASGAKVLLSSGSGTIDASLYYSADGGGGTCGPANGISSFSESRGYSFCEPNVGYKTLMERGSNNVVALPASLMSGLNKADYCGRRVVVTIDGKERNDLNLVYWDNCAECSNNGGLDFSSDMFAELFGAKNCGQGRIKNRMSWKLLDEKVVDWS